MDDPNKLRHVFSDPLHKLDVLVRRYGSEAAAGRAIVAVIDRTFRDGGLAVDFRGRYQQIFNVGGYPVTVRGRIVEGKPRIGTAWMRSDEDQDGKT